MMVMEKYLTDMQQPGAINVLSDALEPIGIIDQYTTLTVAPSFYDVGSFEVELPLTRTVRDLAREDRVVEFGTGGRLAGIIGGVEKSLSPSGTRLRLFGTMLDGLMSWRTVVPSDDPALLGWDVATGTVGSIMAHFVRDHAISPSISARAIPLLRLADGIEQVGMETVAKARFDLLSDMLAGVAQYASVGWRIIISGGAFEFQAQTVIDRTNDSDNPLILSTAFGNVSTADSTTDKSNYANTVYALGKGQYENRLYQVYYAGNQAVSGWARREAVADCGNEPSVVRLRELALQKIDDLEKYDSLTLQIIPGMVSANLGDMPTVYLPEIGASYDLVITDLKLTWNGMQRRIEATLGKPPRTLTSQLQRARRLQNIT